MIAIKIAATLKSPARKKAMSRFRCVANVAVLLSVSVACGFAQEQKLPADDLNPNFKAPAQQTDFDKRVAMIPMRDGVKLDANIYLPHGKGPFPIVLYRSPYIPDLFLNPGMLPVNALNTALRCVLVSRPRSSSS